MVPGSRVAVEMGWGNDLEVKTYNFSGLPLPRSCSHRNYWKAGLGSDSVAFIFLKSLLNILPLTVYYPQLFYLNISKGYLYICVSEICLHSSSTSGGLTGLDKFYVT